MAPRRFRIHRVRKLLYEDPTGSLEVVLSVCYILIPGITLALGKTQFPYETVSLLSSLKVHNERSLGIGFILIGIFQLWGAGTEWYKARAITATVAAANFAVIVLAYGFTGELSRQTVPMLIGTTIAEIFVAWRCWHERPWTRAELLRNVEKHCIGQPTAK